MTNRWCQAGQVEISPMDHFDLRLVRQDMPFEP